MWTCPSCQLPLMYSSPSWRCDNGHQFDRAKEGYVNLLLANQKRSKEPGDSKEMINARRAFLDAGFYQPLAQQLVTLLEQNLADKEAALFDAGCGEGYYLNTVCKGLHELGYRTEGAGVDISKPAIQKAAKKYPQCDFAVASSFNLPTPDASHDAVIQVFAPSSEQEIARVLKAHGIWLKVDPAAQHLHQLKQLIYAQTQEHAQEQQVPPGFEVVCREPLSFEFELSDPTQRTNLLKMTPFFWTAKEEEKTRVANELERVGASFDIKLYRKESS